MNHASTIDANKFNKKAILTARTADICRRIVIRLTKNAILEHYAKGIGNQRDKRF